MHSWRGLPPAEVSFDGPDILFTGHGGLAVCTSGLVSEGLDDCFKVLCVGPGTGRILVTFCVISPPVARLEFS